MGPPDGDSRLRLLPAASCFQGPSLCGVRAPRTSAPHFVRPPTNSCGSPALHVHAPGLQRRLVSVLGVHAEQRGWVWSVSRYSCLSFWIWLLCQTVSAGRSDWRALQSPSHPWPLDKASFAEGTQMRVPKDTQIGQVSKPARGHALPRHSPSAARGELHVTDPPRAT